MVSSFVSKGRDRTNTLSSISTKSHRVNGLVESRTRKYPISLVNAKPVKYVCDTCRQSFNRRRLLDRHACTTIDTSCSDRHRVDQAESRKSEAFKLSKFRSLDLSATGGRRGKRLAEEGPCSYCFREPRLVWQYTKCCKSTVTMCCDCRSYFLGILPKNIKSKKVKKKRKQELKRIDALDMASTGGGFESNRRRF